jgi:hypothetical protein
MKPKNCSLKMLVSSIILTAYIPIPLSDERIFEAGDVYDDTYIQAVTAAGSGCRAAIDVINYLENNDFSSRFNCSILTLTLKGNDFIAFSAIECPNV